MFDWIVRLAFNLLFLLLLVRCVISWIRPSHYHPIVRWVEDVTEPILSPIRRVLPPWKTAGIDFSPAIAMLLAWVVAQILMAILP
ncbi:MAG: YggT family protein [Armatimonadetes bacterium]|nr:YggT family protein [Armatimonadota bacterium]MDW8027995.1 YggT family protein [Armatimonadota bacterium]